jgi:hypothetical protein
VRFDSFLQADACRHGEKRRHRRYTKAFIEWSS